MTTDRRPIRVTLHHLESSQSQRTLWALEELAEAKDLEYDLKVYPRMFGPQKDIQKISPQATSPVLQVDYNDGTTEIKTESILILKWLHKTYGDNIWRVSPQDEERDEFFAQYAQGTFSLRVNFTMLFEVVPASSPFWIRPIMNIFFHPVAKHFKNDLARFIQPMEDALQDYEWFGGRKMGLSDIMMIWGMDMAMARDYIDKNSYPRITNWHQQIVDRPAYKRALAKGGKYDLSFVM